MQPTYRVNLDQLMQLYSANYMLMMRLFPCDISRGERLAVHPVVGADFYLDCKEQTPYTSLLQISQAAELEPQYRRPHFLVRLYHDARVAEVCASQQIYRLKPRYDYPNKKMHQRDEKHQTNQHLHDWLHFCLTQRIKVERVLKYSE